MNGFVNIGVLEEFTGFKPARKTVEGKEIIVLRIDGELVAYENNCPHQHFSVLHQGAVEEGKITCPMHGWVFDLKSGQSLTGNGKLRKIAVKAERNSVWVESTDQERRFSLFD